MSFLDDLLAGVKNVAIGGTIIATTGAAPTLNFVSGATGVYNASTHSYDVTITGGGSFTPGGDLTGNGSTQYSKSISGNGGAGGTVALNIVAMQFAAAQTAAALTHATAASDVTPANMVLGPQGPFASATTVGHKTPGSLVVALAAPVSGGNNAAFAVSEGGTRFFGLSNGILGFGAGVGMWVGSANLVTPTIANLAFAYVAQTMDWILPDTQADVGWQNDGSIQIVGGTVSVSGPLNSSVYVGIASPTTGAFFVGTNYLSGGGWVFEAGYVGSTGRRVTALNQCNITGITTTQLPSGDGVSWFGKAITNVTTAPTLGFALWADATTGHPWVCVPGGSPFEIVAGVTGGITQLTGDVTAGPGSGSQASTLAKIQGTTITITAVSGLQLIQSNAGGTAWSNVGVSGDLTSSSLGVFNVAGLSGANNTTAAIPLRAGAYINATANNPIIKSGSISILNTDAFNQINIGDDANITNTFVRALTESALVAGGVANVQCYSAGVILGGTLALGVATSNSASAGAASALPGNPATYATIKIGVTTYKMALWS